MQALILAAGRGSRLGRKGFGRPKCLLEVGRRPLIEHQLEMLAEAGVAPVALVVGYCADEVREVVGIRAEYIENSRWEVTNSLYSFWLARDWVKGPLLILNSDILVAPEILERLLETDGDAFAYDSSSGDAREHMKVSVREGVLKDMCKGMPASDVSGENVGLLKFTADTTQALFDVSDRLVASGEEKSWLGSSVRLLAKHHRLRAVDVAGLPWGEIDSSFDLDRARKEVLPRIRRSQRRRTPRWRMARWAAVALVVFLFGLVAFKAFKTPEIAWENVEIESAERVEILAGDRTSHWWLLAGESMAQAAVSGPGVVRIDSRLVLSDSTKTLPYVLEVGMDGERLDWFKQAEPRSGTWQHPEWVVAKRGRIQLDVPRGPHVLDVRLVASDTGRCLVRVQQTSKDGSGEDE